MDEDKIITSQDLAKWNQEHWEKFLKALKTPWYREYEPELFFYGAVVLITFCCLLIIWGVKHL